MRVKNRLKHEFESGLVLSLKAFKSIEQEVEEQFPILVISRYKEFMNLEFKAKLFNFYWNYELMGYLRSKILKSLADKHKLFGSYQTYKKIVLSDLKCVTSPDKIGFDRIDGFERTYSFLRMTEFWGIINNAKILFRSGNLSKIFKKFAIKAKAKKLRNRMKKVMGLKQFLSRVENSNEKRNRGRRSLRKKKVSLTGFHTSELVREDDTGLDAA